MDQAARQSVQWDPDRPCGHNTAVNLFVTGGKREPAQAWQGMEVGTVAFCPSRLELHVYLNSMWVKERPQSFRPSKAARKAASEN